MYIYENAIIEDLNRLFINSDVKAVISDSLEESLRRTAAENEDKITLPFITLVGGTWTLQDTNYYGMMYGKNAIDKEIIKNESVIAFTPEYEMYVVAASSRECDMLTREIIFHYNQNPTLTITVPYGLNTLHTFNLVFGNTIRKTSRQTGLVYRVLNLTLNGAYLWHNNSITRVKHVNTEIVDVIEKENKQSK